MNRIEIFYVNMRIFGVPDGQQPSNDRSSLFYKKHAFDEGDVDSPCKLHIFYVPDDQAQEIS